MAKQKRKKTIGDVISTIVMLAALGVFIYAAITLYGYYKEYKAGDDEYNNLNDTYVVGEDEKEEAFDLLENEDQSQSERIEDRNIRKVRWDNQDLELPVMANPIDFEGLQAQNDELVGWLKVRALDISYPIMQADDNEFYLHKTFEKQYNFAGCIFLNCDNRPDFSDLNSIIYGHNMKSGSMFGSFRQLQDEKVFNKSKYFWIYTKDLIFQYRIFAMSVVGNSGLAYQTFYTDKEFQELLDTVRKNSEVSTAGVDVTTSDRIATLSTCTGDYATRRVIMGKLVQIYASK